ncbi:hypothetical protein ACQ9LF_13230, partial [Anaerohalosphaeraceae bacterium U12dextr]
ENLLNFLRQWVSWQEFKIFVRTGDCGAAVPSSTCHLPFMNFAKNFEKIRDMSMIKANMKI